MRRGDLCETRAQCLLAHGIPLVRRRGERGREVRIHSLPLANEILTLAHEGGKGARAGGKACGHLAERRGRLRALRPLRQFECLLT